MTNRANGDYVYVAYARALLDYLDEHGIAAHQVAAAAGIDAAVLTDPQASLSGAQYCLLWKNRSA